MNRTISRLLFPLAVLVGTTGCSGDPSDKTGNSDLSAQDARPTQSMADASRCRDQGMDAVADGYGGTRCASKVPPVSERTGQPAD